MQTGACGKKVVILLSNVVVPIQWLQALELLVAVANVRLGDLVLKDGTLSLALAPLDRAGVTPSVWRRPGRSFTRA